MTVIHAPRPFHVDDRVPFGASLVDLTFPGWAAEGVIDLNTMSFPNTFLCPGAQIIAWDKPDLFCPNYADFIPEFVKRIGGAWPGRWQEESREVFTFMEACGFASYSNDYYETVDDDGISHEYHLLIDAWREQILARRGATE